MGYYMRFLVTDAKKLDVPSISAGLATKDPNYRVESSGADSGDLYLGKELLGELELIARARSSPTKSSPSSKRRSRISTTPMPRETP